MYEYLGKDGKNATDTMTAHTTVMGLTSCRA